LEEGIKELVAAVEKLPGGKFKLKLQSQGHAGDGVDFLGHHLLLSGDKVRVEPSHLNSEAILQAGNVMAAKVASASQEGDNKSAMRHVEGYGEKVKGWLAAFSACDNIEEFQALLEFGIEQNALPLKVNAKTLLETVKPSYEYSSDEYQYV
jgi:hypothetical protein